MVTQQMLELVDATPEEGWSAKVVRANNRNIKWDQICSEMIDNSLEHSHDLCLVRMEWNTKSRSFRVVDNGRGAENLDPFMKPGLGAPTGRATGNSTFGTGLFVCECVITNGTGSVKIATSPGGGSIHVAFRKIDISQGYQATIVPEDYRNDYGLRGTGTSITFNRFSKNIPDNRQMERINESLGRAYSEAMNDGLLQIELVRNGHSEYIVAEQKPACEKTHKELIHVRGGHSYEIEWGVTKTPNRDGAVRLIYGGKFFDKTTEPCGDYRLGRFFAQIKIPRTAGSDVMDLLKRSVEHSSLDDVYDQCAELFKECLQESDRLCSSDDDVKLTGAIETLLSKMMKSGDSRNPNGNTDAREFNGRDLENDGVKPKNTNRKRKGRRGGSRAPSSLKVDWIHSGASEAMAEYNIDGHRLSYNLDVPQVATFKEDSETQMLASIGASHIAFAIHNSSSQKHFGFSDQAYPEIYKEMIKRICE